VRKKTLNKITADERGQALIIVIILMLIGVLIIAPMLSHVGSGLKTGKDVYEERAYGQYAADSGVEDALFKIQVDDTLLPDEWDGPWIDQDVYNTPCQYTISSPVNGNTVTITIQAQWALQDLETPPNGMTPHADLVVVGDIVGEEDGNGLYQISINYTQDIRTLHVERVGAWLPAGYTYVPGTSNLEDDDTADYYCVPTVNPHRGGQAIMWDFGSPRPEFQDLPSDGEKGIVTFQFTPEGRPASAFSWVKIQSSDIYLSWDVDLKFYQITSDAKDIKTDKIITAEAYIAQNVMRDMGTAVWGDYLAIGATLMTGGPPIRNTLLAESDATASTIPASGRLEAAYLYWSAWLVGNGISVPPFPDSCDNFDNWQAGSRWEISGGFWNYEFLGSGGSTDGARTLTLNVLPAGSLDLSPYVDYDVVRVTWDQDASSDVDVDEGLYLAFSGDGGSNWSDPYIEVFLGNNPPSAYNCIVPDEYITDSFKMKLFWDANNNNDRVYIDDISVEAIDMVRDDSVIFKVNGAQVYFDSDGDPAFGNGEVTANIEDRHFLENFTGSGQPNGFSYACNKDVTELIKFAGVTTGNGTYTVGEVEGDTGNEWSYAGWSLIILYSSPDTDRHQIYLYDDRFIYSDMNCNVDFDGDGNPGGLISGFLAPENIMDAEHAARLTCFVGEGDDIYDNDQIIINGDPLSNTESPVDDVWNSKSPGLAADGVDIDTFKVEYPTIRPGDASAQVDLPTETDSWNLVYIILSFSSEVTSGGTISYLVKG